MSKSNTGEKRILIVEDSETIAHSLAYVLEGYGTTNIANNGAEALKKAFMDSYDIIISDIQMPVMDGIEFYKAAVENDPGVKGRFLFHTSSFEEDHLNFIINNAVPVIFKAADTKELLRVVNEILDGSYVYNPENIE
jgi:CheY-like chemotaxis protein